MVTKVWSVFATQIFPLVRSLSTPRRLLDAMAQGDDAVKRELESIKALALNWLTNYVRVYGTCVTPYVHVIGRHLHHMLQHGSRLGRQPSLAITPLASASVSRDYAEYAPARGSDITAAAAQHRARRS